MVFRVLQPLGFYTTLHHPTGGHERTMGDVCYLQKEAVVVYLGWAEGILSVHEFLLPNGKRGFQSERWNISMLISHCYLNEV